MPENAGPGRGLKIVHTRVYYDPGSGDIVHIHKLAVPEEETLDATRIEEEMSVFDNSIEQRHGRVLESVDVEAGTLDEVSGRNIRFRIDLRTKRIVSEDLPEPA